MFRVGRTHLKEVLTCAHLSTPFFFFHFFFPKNSPSWYEQGQAFQRCRGASELLHLYSRGDAGREMCVLCTHHELICYSVSGNSGIFSSMLLSSFQPCLASLRYFFLNFHDLCVLPGSEAQYHPVLAEVTVICFSSSESQVFPNQMNSAIQGGLKKTTCELAPLAESKEPIFFSSQLSLCVCNFTELPVLPYYIYKICVRGCCRLKRGCSWVLRLSIKERSLVCTNQFQMIVSVPLGHEQL